MALKIADDEHWMCRCITLAQEASNNGEVPVGCVIVAENQVIGEGYNSPISRSDPTAHAEIVALRAAALAMKNYRLPNTTLYVSLEPCAMCAAAMVHARVSDVVFATREPKAGVVVSRANYFESPWLNHRVKWREGVLADKAGLLLQDFFKSKR